jgi:hypothetical protein
LLLSQAALAETEIPIHAATADAINIFFITQSPDFNGIYHFFINWDCCAELMNCFQISKTPRAGAFITQLKKRSKASI